MALVARNQKKLHQDKDFVEQAAGGADKATVKTYSTDITEFKKFASTLTQIGQDLGTPECIFFNAALVRPSKLLEVSEEDMVYDYKASYFSRSSTLECNP